MRALLASVGTVAVIAFATTASAEPIRIAPVALSEQFQQELAEDYGEREGPVLQHYIERALTRELARAGAQVGETGAISIEITLVDADATKPTFAQLSRRLGLDYFGSISVGGAQLTAVLRGADGGVLAEIDHRRYARGLDEASITGGAWGDAFRSIRIFAAKVTRAYRAQLSSAQTAPT